MYRKATGPANQYIAKLTFLPALGFSKPGAGQQRLGVATLDYFSLKFVKLNLKNV